MVDKFVDTHPQFTIVRNGSFAPNADGEVEFFTVGNTGDSNRKNTFSDADLTTPNPNPVPLDGNGRSVNPIFLDGSYNTVIRDSEGVQQDEVDNVSGGSGGGVPSIDVDLVADLRAVDTLSFQKAYTLGATEIGDGGQGDWYFDENDTQSDNGISVIEPTVGGGRWLLQNNAHNSTYSVLAGGTVDAIVITTSPTKGDLDSTRIFVVESIGPNTITGVTVKRDATANLPLLRDQSTPLLVGDTGLAGYKMIIELLDDESAYILLNPYKLLSAQVPNRSITYAKLQNIVTANRVLGRTSAGEIQEVQIVQAMIADQAITENKVIQPTGGTTIIKRLWGATGSVIPGPAPTIYPDADGSYGNDQNTVNQQVGFNALLDGVIRVGLDHRNPAGVNGNSFVRVLKNGSQQVEWSTGSSTYSNRTQDIAVAMGDAITIQQRAEFSTGGTQWRNVRVLSGVKIFAVA